MDIQEKAVPIAAMDRRAVLMVFAGSALLSTSGCHAIHAIIARLHGDDSFDEGDDDYENENENEKKGDKDEGNRNEPRKQPQSGSDASSGGDTSSDEEPLGE